MSGFGICFTSVICLLVFLTGQGSAKHFWRPPSYPTDPNDPYYEAFQTVPSANVTAKQFMTNFLRIPYWKISTQVVTKRQAVTEDTVAVIDGSGSVASCEFKKGRKALKYIMDEMHDPKVDTKYAAVTFASSATVNFKFLPYSTAASKILTIPYPGGMTNTQAGLAEAKKLFDDPSSGRRFNPTRKTVLLVTDGQPNIYPGLTIPKAQALKNSNVRILVVAVGKYIDGIGELVQVASHPPDQNLLRVETHSAFLKVVDLVLKYVAPNKWVIASGQYGPPC